MNDSIPTNRPQKMIKLHQRHPGELCLDVANNLLPVSYFTQDFGQ